MTKLFYVLCGLVAIIVLWAIFGSNPMDYIMRKHQEHMTKTLVTRIMKHNDPDYMKKSKKPVPRNSGLDMGADTSADKENLDTSDVLPSRNGLLGPGPAIRSGISGGVGSSTTPRENIQPDVRRSTLQSEPEMVTPPQPVGAAVPVQPNGQPAVQPLQDPIGDGYYPPTPADANKPKPQSVLDPLFRKNNGIPLADGTLVKFAGTKVFAVGADGMEKPLKDGEYHIFNDKFVMRIRGGERYIFQ